FSRQRTFGPGGAIRRAILLRRVGGEGRAAPGTVLRHAPADGPPAHLRAADQRPPVTAAGDLLARTQVPAGHLHHPAALAETDPTGLAGGSVVLRPPQHRQAAERRL